MDETRCQIHKVETTLKMLAKAQVELGANINVVTNETIAMVFKEHASSRQHVITLMVP